MHNASIELAKSIGKVLHALLINVEFDMKDVLRRVAIEDISKIHEWIQWFDRNDYLRKNKIYRNMNDKLNFYKKLEIPVLQDAYNRISRALKMGEKLAEKGEFSILNISQANFVNKSVMSTNKSVVSLKNDSMQMEAYPLNILDELNNEHAFVNTKKETVGEIVTRLCDKLNLETSGQLSPNMLSDSIKKIQLVTGLVIR